MRAIIVDDEIKVRKVLKNLIQKYDRDIDIIAEAGSVEEGYKQIIALKPDVVFLDIEMQDGDGFQLLNEFDEDRLFKVIFVTSHTQYSIKALKNNAFDYLIKPIMIDELKDTLARLKRQAKPITTGKNSEGSLIVNTKNKIETIPFETIIYLKGDINYTFIHTETRQFHVAKTLLEYEELLCTNNPLFMRIHKTYIVNVSCISHIQKGDKLTAALKNGELISLSRIKKDDLLKVLALKA